MSKYRFIVRNYHAIQEADIIIDGITILSGINGCGKSTLSRWLYYLIKGTADFENNLLHEFIKKLQSLIDRMSFVCRDLERMKRANLFSEKEDSARDKLYEIQEQLKQLKSYSPQHVELAQNLFLKATAITENTLLQNLLDEKISDARKERIMTFLNGTITNKDLSQAIDDFTEQNRRLANKLASTLLSEINERSAYTFFETLNRQFHTENDYPPYIQLEEDEVNIIDEHLSNLYNLHDAIYIDTPMSITSDATDNIFWNSLRTLITDEQKRDESTDIKKLLFRIKSLIDGEAVLKKEDNLFLPKELRYISSDQQINIRLSEVATGFKTFSYLQRLLENGYLNEETLLMIDEPEAHLHPQWIVEFARILVLLNKTLGLKIMIASHNPDMVSAIHDIAEKEGILPHTHFYVAQQCPDNKHKFVYKDLGHEISEIFESFNIALDRIKEYGATGL